MHMRQKHRDAEEKRKYQEKSAKPLLTPEDERHKKWKPGVPREKVIALKRKKPIHAPARVRSTYRNLTRISAHMREANEERAKDDEERDRFEPKKQIARPESKQHKGSYPENERACDNDEIKVHDGQVIQKKITGVT